MTTILRRFKSIDLVDKVPHVDNLIKEEPVKVDQIKENKEAEKIVVEPFVSDLAPEYGYKYEGPEPTRYGDWEIKGRCYDF